MTVRRVFIALSVALATWLLPHGTAMACAVCGASTSTKSTLDAYLGITIGLSALPLMLIGGLIYWVRRNQVATAAVLSESDADA